MINNGKVNQMPAQEGRLTEAQIHVLTSVCLGLSNKASKGRWAAFPSTVSCMQEQSSRVIAIAPAEKIYPRSVSGRFANWRWALVVLTQLVFMACPGCNGGHRQAVLSIRGARRFYIFGLVLYPQDFIYPTGLLVVSALSLFLFTAVAGGVVGYACPQTVYTEIFLWLEKITEGDRSAGMRRDAKGWTWDTTWRKTAKQTLWVSLALWTGFTFVGYFTPIQELGQEVVQLNLGSWEIFWTLSMGWRPMAMPGSCAKKVCFAHVPLRTIPECHVRSRYAHRHHDSKRGEPRACGARHVEPATLGAWVPA